MAQRSKKETCSASVQFPDDPMTAFLPPTFHQTTVSESPQVGDKWFIKESAMGQSSDEASVSRHGADRQGLLPSEGDSVQQEILGEVTLQK